MPLTGLSYWLLLQLSVMAVDILLSHLNIPELPIKRVQCQLGPFLYVALSTDDRIVKQIPGTQTRRLLIIVNCCGIVYQLSYNFHGWSVLIIHRFDEAKLVGVPHVLLSDSRPRHPWRSKFFPVVSISFAPACCRSLLSILPSEWLAIVTQSPVVVQHLHTRPTLSHAIESDRGKKKFLSGV